MRSAKAKFPSDVLTLGRKRGDGREGRRRERNFFSRTREVHSSREFARSTYSMGKIKGSRTDLTVTTTGGKREKRVYVLFAKEFTSARSGANVCH